MNKHLSIGKSAEYLGISLSTMYRWEIKGLLTPCFRTNGNHRRYSISKLLMISKNNENKNDNRKIICYARVSTHSQKKDLETQKQVLIKYCNDKKIQNYELINDLGSGLNYKKKGLNKLIELITSNKIKKIIVTHKDRLLRFGSEIIQKLCHLFHVDFFILNFDESKSFEQGFCEDICEIMTVFSSKLYGKRSHKNKKTLKT